MTTLAIKDLYEGIDGTQAPSQRIQRRLIDTTNTSFNPGAGAGTDEQGRPLPADTIAGQGWQFQTPTIVQANTATIGFNDCQILFTDGISSLFGADSPMASANANVNWELDRCHFICSRDPGDTNVSGWGHVDIAATSRGYFRDCTWQGTRVEPSTVGGSDGGFATWFVNFDRTNADFEFANPTFVLSVLNLSRNGFWISGANFDGTIRANPAQTQYTIRINQLEANGSAMGIVQSNFANFHDTNEFAYATGSGISDTALRANNGVHFQILDGDTASTREYWSINNRYESGTIAVQGRRGRFREVYTWRPRVMIAGTNNVVPDASVQGLLTADPTAANTQPATFANNGAVQSMYPVPATVDPTDAPTVFPSTLTGRETVTNLISNGVFVLTSALSSATDNSAYQVKKALNWATDNTYELADPTTDSHAVGFKSYTHLVDADLMTRPNLITYGGGNAGAITFQENDVIQAELDPNLNNRAVDFSGFSGSVNIAFDDWYPLVKSRWYNAGTHERNPASHDGQAITFTSPMEWDDDSTYDVDPQSGEVREVGIRYPGILNPATTNRIIADGTTVTLNNPSSTVIGDGLALETRNGGSMNLAGVTWSGAVDLTGTFSNVNGQAITASATTDRPVILGDDTDITINNVGSGGEITLRPVTHTGTASNTITLRSSVPITVRVPPTSTGQIPQQWDTAESLSAGVTIAAAAPSPINYVITTGSLAGQFAIRNVDKGTYLTEDPNDPTNPIMPVSAGSPITFRINSLDANASSAVTQGDDLVIYYKAFNTATNGYTTNIVPLTVTALTEEMQVPVLQAPIANILYSTERIDGASVDVVDRASLGDNPGIQVNITGATSQDTSGNQAQNLMLMATDTRQYLEFVSSIAHQEDIIRPANQGTGTTGSLVTLNGVNAQQFLLAVSGGPTVTELTGVTGVQSVILARNPDGATIDDIIQGINASAIGMDQAALASNVADLQTATTAIGGNVVSIGLNVNNNRRATAYLIGNGTSTGTAGSRLNGIRPKQADFDPTTTYEDILE